MAQKQGSECVLLIDMGETAENFQPFTKVRDVDLDQSMNTSDATTREDDGWENKAAGLRSWGFSTEAKWDPDDTVMQKVRQAYYSTPPKKLRVKVLDETDGNGPVGYVLVTDFSRSEPLEGIVTVSVTMEGCGKPSWSS